jgi:hypothetical protein
MNSQAVLFQILYQHDILFQLNDGQSNTIVEEVAASPEKPTIRETVIPQENISPPTQKTVQIALAPALQQFPMLKHNILILTDQPEQQEMKPSESVFLDNILKAVKYSVDQADLVNISFLPPTDASKVISDRKTDYLIIFGVQPLKLNLDLLLSLYTPKQINNVWCLLADPLVKIEADRDLKRKLWQALQIIFGAK